MEAKGPPTPIYCSALCLYETSSLDLIIKITHGDQEDHLNTKDPNEDKLWSFPVHNAELITKQTITLWHYSQKESAF